MKLKLETIQARVTKAEKTRVHEEAKRLGMSDAGYLKFLVNNGRVIALTITQAQDAPREPGKDSGGDQP